MTRNYFKYFFYLVAVVVFSIAKAEPKADYFKAVEIDAADTVSDLLKSGFDPNTLNDKGQPGLVLALHGGSPRVTRVLLEHPGTNVDLANGNGETPLMMAALRGNFEVAKRLLARGAQVNRDGWSPLHYAASGSSLEIVSWLLEQGARIDAPSPNRTSPLMMAAGYGAIDAADLLAQRGADRQLKNDRGLTAADFAKRAGRDTLATRLQPR